MEGLIFLTSFIQYILWLSLTEVGYWVLKEVDLGEATQLLQIIRTFVFNILHQSYVSIKVTWSDFILIQMNA